MKRSLQLWFATLSILLATAALADIKQQGGHAISDKIGPWFIVKATYEDGAHLCFAHNLSYGRGAPFFSFKTAKGGKYPGSWVSFQSERLAADGETVRLSIGSLSVDLRHKKGDADYLFGPVYVQEFGQIIEALLAAEKSTKKSFHVVDKAGKSFRFDARSTARMLDYMERNCGFSVD